jgi:NADH dehydrogenase/NADH:ubiquinone oxidoreductase subunit G
MIVNLNGRDLIASPEETLLQVARRNGIKIPTLCEHAGLAAWGGCRLCVVEMTRAAGGPTRVVPSCLQPVEDGLRVETHTARILRIRAVLLDLLLARAPEARQIQELALEHGVKRTSFVPRVDPDKCILCNVCVRACAAVGADAIATAGRGAAGRISLPFGEDAAACVGCGACALSCPTDAIEMVDRGGQRRIWGRTFERLPCASCGAPTLTREHAAHLVTRTGLPAEGFGVCERCRREQASRQFLDLVGK